MLHLRHFVARSTLRAVCLASASLLVVGASAQAVRAETAPAVFGPEHPAPVDHPHADAGYSGRPDTLPAAMLDGDPATGWSNGFLKQATPLLPAFEGARAEDWVCVDHGRTRGYDRVDVSFTVDATHSLPAAIEVAVWDGRAWQAARDTEIGWATASDAPTVITFKAVRGSRIRLTLTSRHPGEPRGAIRISRLDAPAA